MTRSNAREIAVHLLFAQDFHHQPAADAVASLTDGEYYGCLAAENDAYAERVNQKQRAYILQLLEGVEEHREELDACIEAHAIGWKLSRIPRLSLAILRVALYEIRYMEDVPVGVSVNEAVNLAKKYEDAEMAAYINGVLGSVVRES
jgi:N utilization substance protein B